MKAVTRRNKRHCPWLQSATFRSRLRPNKRDDALCLGKRHALLVVRPSTRSEKKPETSRAGSLSRRSEKFFCTPQSNSTRLLIDPCTILAPEMLAVTSSGLVACAARNAIPKAGPGHYLARVRPSWCALRPPPLHMLHLPAGAAHARISCSARQV